MPRKNALSNLKFIIEENLPVRVQPPLPKLPAFNVAALILSYYGYNDKVKRLLKRLNRNSRKYFISHKEILKAFLSTWKPRVAVDYTKNMAFGSINEANRNAQWGCNKEYQPSQQLIHQIEAQPSWKATPKLRSIHIKCLVYMESP